MDGTAAIVAPETTVLSKCLRDIGDIGGRVYRRMGHKGSDSAMREVATAR
jgi:hypothetical protein